MVNLDSDLARAHPDWIVGPSVLSYKDGGRLPHPLAPPARPGPRQPGGLAVHLRPPRRPAARERHRLPQVGPEPGPHRARAAAAARPSTSRRWPPTASSTRSRQPTPDVEIESCSSGGRPRGPRHPAAHRPGLGIGLQRRPGAPDHPAVDPARSCRRSSSDRISAPPRSHTTARTHDISFRAITALFGHFGMEWDIRAASDEPSGPTLRRAIALYKQPPRAAPLRQARDTRPTSPIPPSGSTASWRTTAARPCSRLVSLASAARRGPRAGLASRALTRSRHYRVRTELPTPATGDYAHTFTADPAARLAGRRGRGHRTPSWQHVRPAPCRS